MYYPMTSLSLAYAEFGYDFYCFGLTGISCPLLFVGLLGGEMNHFGVTDGCFKSFVQIALIIAFKLYT